MADLCRGCDQAGSSVTSGMTASSTLAPTQNHRLPHWPHWLHSPGIILKLWLAIIFFCPAAIAAEEEDVLDPNHMYVVTFMLGEGATEAALDSMWDYFTDTYPMTTMLLPDDFINKEKKTITMIGPSLAQIVDFVEAFCNHTKVEIKIMKAGKLTKESAESVIKKIKTKGTDEEAEPKKAKETVPGKAVEPGKVEAKPGAGDPIP